MYRLVLLVSLAALVALVLVSANPIDVDGMMLERRGPQTPGMQSCGGAPGMQCPGVVSSLLTFNFNNRKYKKVQEANSRESAVYINNKDVSASNIQTNSNTNLSYVGPV
ncbi:hypothetical protein FBU59_002471 [Linderina macrospora]|uniref:Uncharacterized protein n=1 Tax=Linderina macrospora TaxID=4868 RepID=A0ACC1JB82_9FUNG|nr:hypothetical protein FBU59_002471 [Linderina macrospora]